MKNCRTPAVLQLLLCDAWVRQFFISSIYSRAKRFGQLIGAGGILKTALDSLDPAYAFFNVHAFNKASDAFQVSVATAFIGDVADFSVFNIESDFS